MWGEQIDVHTPMIGATIRELEPALSADVWEACARSALSDGAPDELVRAQSERWIQTWRALDTWFGRPVVRRGGCGASCATWSPRGRAT